jgi:hypothetical protein
MPAGQPLDATTRALMEPRFGRDFSGVRVHVDGSAPKSAEAMRARAYTVGRNIVFAPGAYAPRSDTGQRLVAHELAHVVQNESQPQGASPTKLVSDAGDASEREAHAAADHAVSSNEIRIGAAPSALVQRDGNDVGIGLGIAGAVVGGALIGLAIAGIAGAFDKKKPEESPDASLDNPDFRKKWEAGLEEGLKKLESAQPEGCRFPEGEEVAYDRENWNEIVEGEEGKLSSKSYQAKTADSFKAAELLFTRLNLWTCDCRMFGEIALLHAWWSALKDDKAQFNKRFAKLTLRAENTTGISRKTVQPDVMAEFDDATWESAPIGSKVVWQNGSPYAKAPWSFEHGIKRSMARAGQEAVYAAQGIATDAPAEAASGIAVPARKVLRSTESQVKLAMAKHCLGDFPYVFEITDASIQKLSSEGVDAATLKKLEAIKNVPVKGMDKFVQQPVLTDINGGVLIQPTAEIPFPKIRPIVRAIVKHAEKKNPPDNDPEVTKYVNDNIKRYKIEIPT